MLLTDAKTYVARIYGGTADTSLIAQALDAIKSAYEELLHKNNWAWLRLDTSQSFTVADCDPEVGTTLTTGTADGFKNVLVGMTVSGTDITAGTKVASITSTTEIELDTAATGTTNGTITFGGTIPIISGTDSYTLPAPFWKPYTCRLVSTQKYRLTYIPPNKYDALSWDQTIPGLVVAYTVYTPASFDASGTQQTKIRFIRVPDADDVALLKYYRLPDFSGTYVDVPDEFLYTLLDFARVHLLRSKDATSRRLPLLTRDVERRIASAIAADREEGGDDQMDAFRTPIEHAHSDAYTGLFWPRGDEVWRGGL